LSRDFAEEGAIFVLFDWFLINIISKRRLC